MAVSSTLLEASSRLVVTSRKKISALGFRCNLMVFSASGLVAAMSMPLHSQRIYLRSFTMLSFTEIRMLAPD